MYMPARNRSSALTNCFSVCWDDEASQRLKMGKTASIGRRFTNVRVGQSFWGVRSVEEVLWNGRRGMESRSKGGTLKNVEVSLALTLVKDRRSFLCELSDSRRAGGLRIGSWLQIKPDLLRPFSCLFLFPPTFYRPHSVALQLELSPPSQLCFPLSHLVAPRVLVYCYGHN